MDEATRGAVLAKLALTNIPGYVLDTENLSVIRASSDQLDRLARDTAEELSSDGVLYAAGSEVLAYFAAPCDEDSGVRALTQAFDAVTRRDPAVSAAGGRPLVTATCRAVRQGPDEPLDRAVMRVENRLRRAQMAQASVVPGELSGNVECGLDGVRPADVETWVGDGTRKVSRHAEARLRSGRVGRRLRVEQLLGPVDAPADLADGDASGAPGHQWDESFEGLERFSPPGIAHGKMCVLHVDGNQFGSVRTRLTLPQAWRELTGLVEDAMTGALRSALRDLWLRAHDVDALPVHILYFAGDEFRIVVPADAGVDVALGVLESFSGGFTELVATRLPSLDDVAVREELSNVLEDATLTLAAGALFCDSHEPITSATTAAARLCDNAKRRLVDAATARQAEAGNVVDFAVVESGMIPSSLDDYREGHQSRPVAPEEPSRMLRYPLRRGEFRALVDDVRVLKRAGFSSGRAAALVGLSLSTQCDKDVSEAAFKVFERVEWAALEGRLDDAEAVARLRVLRPHTQADCVPGSPFMTPWLARRELWDYVDDAGSGVTP